MMLTTTIVPSNTMTPYPDYEDGGEPAASGGGGSGEFKFRIGTGSQSNVKFTVNGGNRTPGPVSVQSGDEVTIDVYYK